MVQVALVELVEQEALAALVELVVQEALAALEVGNCPQLLTISRNIIHRFLIKIRFTCNTC